MIFRRQGGNKGETLEGGMVLRPGKKTVLSYGDRLGGKSR